MKIIRLTDKDTFDAKSRELLDVVLNDYNPDFLIGIKTGGGFVGRIMNEEMKARGIKATYWEGRVKRKLTDAKEKYFAKKILPLLPHFITDLMIRTEVYLLERFSKKKGEKRIIDKGFFEAIAKIIEEQKLSKILLIDDCIDTGSTLKAVVDYINEHTTGLEVKTAVISTTHKNPLLFPDFVLYPRSLCRFPWSMEVKNG